MTTTVPTRDFELAELIADTENEILRSSATATRPPTASTRWSATTSGSTARARPAASGCGRSSACSPTPRSPASTSRRCRAPRRSSSGHNFSLVHDDIEDGDVERRHRPTLWREHGIPQAINTGDTLFSLSRIALHRLTDLGFSDAKVLRLMRLYDETCLALCEGQYIDIWTERHERADVGRALPRHDRPQDGRPHHRLDRGRRAAGDRRRGGHRPLSGFGWALGLAFQINDDLLGIWGAEQSTGKEPTDLAHHKKTLPVIYAARARRSGGPRPARSRCTRRATDRRPSMAEAVAILERTGARDYTRDQAHRYRDEALAELDAAGV